MPALPSGTVTLLFTDIEGSTQLLHRPGDRYASLLRDHHRLLRLALRALAAHAWPDGVLVRVRMGLDSGEPTNLGALRRGGRALAARSVAAAHGRQVLLSPACCHQCCRRVRVPASLPWAPGRQGGPQPATPPPAGR